MGEGVGGGKRKGADGKAQGEALVVKQRNLAKAHPTRLVQQTLYASWKAVDLKLISDIARTYSHS